MKTHTILMASLLLVSTITYSGEGTGTRGGGDIVEINNRIILGDEFVTHAAPMGEVDAPGAASLSLSDDIKKSLAFNFRAMRFYGWDNLMNPSTTLALWNRIMSPERTEEALVRQFLSDQIASYENFPNLYLVDALPKQRFCYNDPSSYSLPSGARLSAAACTMRGKTYILRSVFNELIRGKKLTIGEFSLLLLHERLRGISPGAPLEVIACATQGVRRFNEIYKRQAAGLYQAMSQEEFEKLQNMRECLIDLSNRPVGMSEFNINRLGGGLVHRNSQLRDDTFVSLFSVVFENVSATGPNAKIVFSSINNSRIGEGAILSHAEISKSGYDYDDFDYGRDDDESQRNRYSLSSRTISLELANDNTFLLVIGSNSSVSGWVLFPGRHHLIGSGVILDRVSCNADCAIGDGARVRDSRFSSSNLSISHPPGFKSANIDSKPNGLPVILKNGATITSCELSGNGIEIAPKTVMSRVNQDWNKWKWHASYTQSRAEIPASEVVAIARAWQEQTGTPPPVNIDTLYRGVSLRFSGDLDAIAASTPPQAPGPFNPNGRIARFKCDNIYRLEPYRGYRDQDTDLIVERDLDTGTTRFIYSGLTAKYVFSDRLFTDRFDGSANWLVSENGVNWLQIIGDGLHRNSGGSVELQLRMKDGPKNPSPYSMAGYYRDFRIKDCSRK